MRTKSSPQGSIDHPIDPIAFALGAGATFVARSIDVDGPHLQQTLRRAHAHKGTAFVEILQNCPVFNDKEWSELEDRKTRLEAALLLEDGKPLVFAAEGARGIRIENGVPSVVELGEGEDPAAAGVAIHRSGHQSPAYAFALASLARPRFPIPIGVIRAVEQPTYEAVLQKQIDDAIATRGPGDLAALLHSGDTWTVEE
jgi:2-oxoglutarate ferredoxin oxidoreductase subunit beta